MREWINLVESSMAERDEEKHFWKMISQRFSKHQIKLMKAFSRSRQKLSTPDLWFHSVVPQWFYGAPPIKGLDGVPAPVLDPESKQKFLALWNLAESSSDNRIRNGALLFANVFLIEGFFPEDYNRRLPPAKSVIDFDPRTNDLEQIVKDNSQPSSQWRALSFDVHTLDSVRICDNKR